MKKNLELIKKIQLNLNLLADYSEEQEIENKSFLEPTQNQLELINKFIGWKSEAEDWTIVNFLASDNLVNRSYRKWSLNVLELMRVKCVENPLIVDHAWDNVDASCGFIIESKLVRSSEAPKKQKLGYEEINQKIIQNEGYVSLILTAAIDSDQPIVNAVKYGALNSCSTGGEMSSAKLICPNCSEENGRIITFTELDKKGNYVCKHLIPDVSSKYYFDDEDYLTADYIELDGDYENLELSLVNLGNLPNAKIIR